MSTDVFKKQIDLFPKHSNDVNILFAVSLAEYKALVLILKTLTLGSSLLKKGLNKSIGKLDTLACSTISKGISALNSTLKSILPAPFKKGMDITVNIGQMGDLLALACTDYLGSLPQDLFNKIQDFKHNANKISKMGAGLVGKLAKDLLKIKDQALKDVLGSEIFNTIISPIIAYESFLKENGIDDLIKRMQKLEKCMMKRGIGNVPKSNFMHPTEKILYSTYYRKQFLLTSSGKLDLKSLGSSASNRSCVNNISKNLYSFRLSVI